MSEITNQDSHAVAVFETHDQAEAAVRALSEKGFDMKNLSVIGQNYHTEEHPVGFVNAGDRMLTWGKFGAFWGAIWGVLLGSAMVFVPGVGYVMFAGWIVSLLSGAVVGGTVAALAGALASIGIPNDSIVQYETAIKAGSFLLIAHGDEAAVAHAKEILSASPATGVETYSTPGTPAATA